MKRALLALLLLFAAPVFGAPEKWYDAYKRGVSAVNASNHREAAAALRQCIVEMPQEGTGVRAGREIITYTPHFWLGIAKFNLGDVDGALREWRISEEQGVITRTEYYATLKNWVARAESEKQRAAQSVATGPKKAADTALSRALEKQLAALRAGGDRTEAYLLAQRKLQEARAQFQKAGTDVNAYKAAEALAQQAAASFTSAAEEGARLKAARPAPVPQKKPQSQAPIPTPAVTEPVKPVVATSTQTPAKQEPPPVPIESEARVDARIAVQQYRRNAVVAPRGLGTNDVREAEALRIRLEQAKADSEYVAIAADARNRDLALAAKIKAPTTPAVATTTAATTNPATVDLAPAYRAFAAGDLSSAERLLTGILSRQMSAEALLLRGCARYTRAMLSRNPESQLAPAAADFRAALQRDRNLRLQRTAFSPKLIAYFEQVRSGG
jgi:hypothetical protein